MNEFVRKFRWLLHRPTKHAALRDEIQFHLQEEVEQHQADGLAPQEARLAALRNFGNVTLIAENTRAEWIPFWLDQIFQELRFALRRLRRDRAFTLTAIVTLALAIGLNVTVFAVMNTMLFRGYPLVQRNDRLVYIQEQYPSGTCCITYLDFEDWRAQAHSFEEMAFVGEKNISLRYGEGRSVDGNAFTVSTNLFGLLGVKPALGRDFVPADEASGAAPVVILNHRFWDSQFGGRRDVVG
ncbi:MAG TPA: permease prefix domain 1-containing protein, partial [Bryobacteraceae bacterium]